ncbi:MAG: hypothetical protein ACE5IR_03120 [bacterium]
MKLTRTIFLIFTFVVSLGCSPKIGVHKTGFRDIDTGKAWIQGAQTVSTYDDARNAAINRLRTGSRIRLKATNSDLLDAKFLRSEDDQIIVSIDRAERSVPVADIEAIWLRLGSAGSGAKWGAISFGVLGILSGVTLDGLCRNLDESEDPEGCPQFIFIGGLAGAAGGALLGAAIGAATQRWSQIYP